MMTTTARTSARGHRCRRGWTPDAVRYRSTWTMAFPLSRSFINDLPPVGDSRGLETVGMHDAALLMWLETDQDELVVAVESQRVAGRTSQSRGSRDRPSRREIATT